MSLNRSGGLPVSRIIKQLNTIIHNNTAHSNRLFIDNIDKSLVEIDLTKVKSPSLQKYISSQISFVREKSKTTDDYLSQIRDISKTIGSLPPVSVIDQHRYLPDLTWLILCGFSLTLTISVNGGFAIGAVLGGIMYRRRSKLENERRRLLTLRSELAIRKKQLNYKVERLLFQLKTFANIK